jgi:hypothetical protein|tara:strand:+ start:85 stop:390 length:306 start_codon:yes stop_codon:yes gene_type:complete
MTTTQTNDIEVIIRPVDIAGLPTRGAWNGYISLKPNHPWFGKDTMDLYKVEVHGGITYAEQEGDRWVIGFDTAHGGDTPSKWPISAVAAQCAHMMGQAYRA